jgi:redox-sensitive bicupin YhaK (pirin superfamily)
MIKLRKSGERGYFNHGWLKSFHSFSFANYYDLAHMNFGNLRVINEDYIEPNQGFATHPHNNMEIITYVISGTLSHKDSMNNSSTINAGEVQLMSAGSGVFHSEFSDKTSETHLLQIWILPNVKNTTPSYQQKNFASEFKNNALNLVVSSAGENGSLQIKQDCKIYFGKFSAGEQFNFEIAKDRKIWIQIIKGELETIDFLAQKGDALAISDEKIIALEISKDVEFLFFDL